MGSRDVSLNIIGSDRTRRATDSAGDNVERLAKRVKASSKAVDRDLDKLGGNAGADFVKGATASLQAIPQIIGALGPAGTTALAAAGAAMAAALGAGIAGGLLAGAGAGGIALGIAGAVRSPQVQAAIDAFKASMGDELDEIGANFEEPLMRSLEATSKAVDRLDIAGVFEPLAPVVETVTGGLIAMAERAMPGIREMMAASAPVIDAIAGKMPLLGEAIGDFAESMAAAGPGAADFFRDLMVFSSGGLAAIGKIVEALSKTYEISRMFAPAVAAYELASGGADGYHGTLVKLNSAQERAAAAQQRLNNELRGMSDAVLGADQAQLAFQTSLSSVTESINTHGTSIDTNTAKGQANVRAVLDAVAATRGLFDAQIAAGQGAYQATAAYQVNIAALEGQMRAAGMTQAQIDALIGRYRAVPPIVNTDVNASTAQADHALQSTRAKLDGIQSKTVVIRVATEFGESTPMDAAGVRGVRGAFSAYRGGLALAADPGGSRTTPPTPIVNASTTVVLDGREIRTIASTEIRHEIDRQAWRARAGVR